MRPPQTFSQKIAKPERRGPEYNPYFWNPRLFGVQFAPEEFRTRLKREMGEELEVTWNPILARWQVWSQSNLINHPICRGWRLLFIHNGPDGEHLPLDSRVMARLFSCSSQANGSGKEYFERIVREMDRDKERRERKDQQDLIDAAMPSFDHAQIKVSGFGKSSGSKFSTYHS